MPDNLTVTVGKFTFTVAPDRWYTPQGVWAKEEGTRIRVGLSDFLQQRSGDIAFVGVEPAGTILGLGEEFSSIETIKVDIALSAPVSGKVVLVNPALEASPEVINRDPYGEGWFCEVEPADWGTDRPRLLDAAAYFDKMKREAEEEAR